MEPLGRDFFNKYTMMTTLAMPTSTDSVVNNEHLGCFDIVDEGKPSLPETLMFAFHLTMLVISTPILFNGTLRTIKSRNEPIYVILGVLCVLALLMVFISAAMLHMRRLACTRLFLFNAFMVLMCVLIPLILFKLVDCFNRSADIGDRKKKNHMTDQ